MKDDENIEEAKIDDEWWRPAVFFYFRITSWIVIPILLAVVLHRFALGGIGSQIGFFVLIAIAFVCTCYGIYREINIYKEEVNQKNDGDK
ncbi:MAG: hypothetical protein ACK4FA_02230 [Candidatus Paceibacteria bacterium]